MPANVVVGVVCVLMCSSSTVTALLAAIPRRYDRRLRGLRSRD